MDGLRYFAYHEPSLVQTLTLSSFLVLLNLARLLGDHAANIGILGELFVGMVYGSPLAGILEDDWQSTFTAVGWLGLLVVVFEGGLTTQLRLAKQNFALSAAVALTGLLTPILLSLIILHLAFGYTLVQAFAAGSALSTTSLGTTISVISQAGFGSTRLGAVLTSAAVADDVVGLVLLQVIISLGDATSGSDHDSQAAAIGWAIGRPLIASLAMLLISYLLTRFITGPFYRWSTLKLESQIRSHQHAYNLLVGIVVLHAYCAVAYLSGTSMLLGAFVAGLVLASLTESYRPLIEVASFKDTYETKIEQVQTYLLRPLFFASIGYGIPIRAMFGGRAVWQGICYTLVCTFSKLVCGAWVMITHQFNRWRRSKTSQPAAKRRGKTRAAAMMITFPPPTDLNTPQKPSLLPVATLLGSAMVARGEIALLILNLAREASPGFVPDELFFIAVWASLLCTIIGPLAVGLLVKRMKTQGLSLPAEWGPVSVAPTTGSAAKKDPAEAERMSRQQPASKESMDPVGPRPGNEAPTARSKHSKTTAQPAGHKVMAMVRPGL